MRSHSPANPYPSTGSGGGGGSHHSTTLPSTSSSPSAGVGTSGGGTGTILPGNTSGKTRRGGDRSPLSSHSPTSSPLPLPAIPSTCSTTTATSTTSSSSSVTPTMMMMTSSSNRSLSSSTTTFSLVVVGLFSIASIFGLFMVDIHLVRIYTDIRAIDSYVSWLGYAQTEIFLRTTLPSELLAETYVQRIPPDELLRAPDFSSLNLTVQVPSFISERGYFPISLVAPLTSHFQRSRFPRADGRKRSDPSRHQSPSSLQSECVDNSGSGNRCSIDDYRSRKKTSSNLISDPLFSFMSRVHAIPSCHDVDRGSDSSIPCSLSSSKHFMTRPAARCVAIVRSLARLVIRKRLLSSWLNSSFIETLWRQSDLEVSASPASGHKKKKSGQDTTISSIFPSNSRAARLSEHSDWMQFGDRIFDDLRRSTPEPSVLSLLHTFPSTFSSSHPEKMDSASMTSDEFEDDDSHDMYFDCSRISQSFIGMIRALSARAARHGGDIDERWFATVKLGEIAEKYLQDWSTAEILYRRALMLERTRVEPLFFISRHIRFLGYPQFGLWILKRTISEFLPIPDDSPWNSVHSCQVHLEFIRNAVACLALKNHVRIPFSVWGLVRKSINSASDLCKSFELLEVRRLQYLVDDEISNLLDRSRAHSKISSFQSSDSTVDAQEIARSQTTGSDHSIPIGDVSAQLFADMEGRSLKQKDHRSSNDHLSNEVCLEIPRTCIDALDRFIDVVSETCGEVKNVLAHCIVDKSRSEGGEKKTGSWFSMENLLSPLRLRLLELHDVLSRYRNPSCAHLREPYSSFLSYFAPYWKDIESSLLEWAPLEKWFIDLKRVHSSCTRYFYPSSSSPVIQELENAFLSSTFSSLRDANLPK